MTCTFWASLIAQLVKNLPAMQGTQVRILGWEYPLEKEVATHSSFLAHGDPTSLAPHERLTDLAVVPRETAHTGAAAREQPQDSPVIAR